MLTLRHQESSVGYFYLSPCDPGNAALHCTVPEECAAQSLCMSTDARKLCGAAPITPIRIVPPVWRSSASKADADRWFASRTNISHGNGNSPEYFDSKDGPLHAWG